MTTISSIKPSKSIISVFTYWVRTSRQQKQNKNIKTKFIKPLMTVLLNWNDRKSYFTDDLLIKKVKNEINV